MARSGPQEKMGTLFYPRIDQFRQWSFGDDHDDVARAMSALRTARLKESCVARWRVQQQKFFHQGVDMGKDCA
jgi:hypothetical protein